MLKDSWDEVSIETIKNCFVKSGLKFTNTDFEIDENENESDDYICSELSERIGLENLNFEDYVNFDNNISVFDENINKSIDEIVEKSDCEIEEVIETDQLEDEESTQKSEEPIKLNDALIAISQLRKFITQCNGIEKSHHLINKLERHF